MKFINPSVEYWPQEAGMKGVWKQIAHATRVCYQSQARDNETDEDFVKRVILKPAEIKDDREWLNGGGYDYDFNKMHGAMLEHGTVYLKLNTKEKVDAIAVRIFANNQYSKVVTVKEYPDTDWALVTTNVRVLIEGNMLNLLERIVEPTNHIKRYTFNVITDIGVTREGNRHRANSTIEESSRYNAYDKGKYGSELTYSKPVWYDNIEPLDDAEFKAYCQDIANDNYSSYSTLNYYLFALKAAEFAYMGMRKCGEKAEHCRQVLPLNTKTNVVWTAYAEDWKHFLALRSSQAVSGTPHPNIKIIADKIAEIAKEQKLW